MAGTYIGTSGFSYNHWKGVFYPENIKQSEWLSYYSRIFNTVELNVTFYRLPAEKSFLNWFKSTPPGFRFAVKGPRQLTHYARLNLTERHLDYLKLFSDRVSRLETKLSCVLWQLPPGLQADTELLEEFLAAVAPVFSAHTGHAFEFRNDSWFTDEIYAVLEKHHATLVCSHSARYPMKCIKTADFSYYRFHGPGSLYNSRYDEKELDDWVEKIAEYVKNDRTVFVYFNNDFYGFAVENALYLKSRLEEQLSSR